MDIKDGESISLDFSKNQICLRFGLKINQFEYIFYMFTGADFESNHDVYVIYI